MDAGSSTAALDPAPLDDGEAAPVARARATYNPLTLTPFIFTHVAAVAGVIWLGWSWAWFGIAIATYYGRMFFVTGAHHRYFSHRTFKTSRWFQLLLAVGAQTTAQKGALWWAAHHRQHHKYSDQPKDLHSVRQRGFYWAHMGWIIAEENDETHFDKVKDLAKYPELVWLNKHWYVPMLAYALAVTLIGGWPGLVWGFFVSTTLLWHGTFTINSLSHVWGSRPYASGDDSRNNFWLALITLGEGWHNNHHHYQASCRQGFRWWQVDVTYYVLRAFQAVGLVWDVKEPPRQMVRGDAPKRRVV